MDWLFLFIASIFEIGWPIGMKMASISPYKILWLLFAIITMIFSGYFLYLAQRTIPIGIAYVIWTGFAASITFLIGVYIFHDPISLIRVLGVLFVIVGIILLGLCN